ncbi:MAG: type II toxin-antitoxin system PemK/MazF family toxin [Bdellovibrionales bacterium]
MTDLQYGDTVLVPYPFTDMNIKKVRPGVIVSGLRYNTATKHIWVMMITRTQRSHWDYDIPIKDFEAAGIFDQSKIRFKIACLDQTLIVKKLGALAPADLQTLKTGINAVMNDAA